MGEHDTFGHAGSSGGVHQDRQVVFTEILRVPVLYRRVKHFGVIGDARFLRAADHDEVAFPFSVCEGFLNFWQKLFFGDDEIGSGVVQYVADLGRRQGVNDRQICCPRTHDPVDQLVKLQIQPDILSS
jgi:hypothetical protein